MNHEKILPMNQPVITSYPNHANILSCVLRYEDSLQWFYNYYIQLFAGKDLSRACYIDFCAPIPWKSCPWLDYQKVGREWVYKKWGSLSEFMMDCIDSDYYVYLYLDQFYIQDSWTYRKHHLVHDSFVHGYDRRKKLFNIADFYKNFKYTLTTVGFSQMDDAFINADISPFDDHLKGIILIKPVKFDYFVFDVNIVKALLQDYLLSKAGSKSYAGGYRIDVGDSRDLWAYGLDVYPLLQEHVELFSQKKTPLDIRAFHVLLDHKSLMLLRIDYLIKQGLLDRKTGIYEQYGKMKEQMMDIRNLAIKSYFTENKKSLCKISDALSQIMAWEKQAVENLLDQLITPA